MGRRQLNAEQVKAKNNLRHQRYRQKKKEQKKLKQHRDVLVGLADESTQEKYLTELETTKINEELIIEGEKDQVNVEKLCREEEFMEIGDIMEEGGLLNEDIRIEEDVEDDEGFTEMIEEVELRGMKLLEVEN